jgi:peptide/nickel transport system ATP-binding protein
VTELAPAAAPPGTDGTLLRVENLVKHFPARGVQRQRGTVVHAVDGVSFELAPGETLGLVGETGCGKSTVARLVTRLLEPTAGRIEFEGRDITHWSRRRLRPLRRDVQIVFQDPYSSLNPRRRVGSIVGAPLGAHGLGGRDERRARVSEVLGLVGLDPSLADRFPYQFSGGQRQRIGIARALVTRPRFVVADEPVSALDVSIQAQVLNLIEDLGTELDLALLFISHDVSVVRHISDRVAVMYLGKIVELAETEDLFAAPVHPYTAALLAAVPLARRTGARRTRVPVTGEPPSPLSPPSGCRFRTRCPFAQEICAEEEPPLVAHRSGHLAACHFPLDAKAAV